MTSEQLCQRFGMPRTTFRTWRQRGIIPPPLGGRTRRARYGTVHIEAIEAHLALRHNNVSTAAAVAYCREAGITLREYVRRRESSIRDFGIGIG